MRRLLPLLCLAASPWVDLGLQRGRAPIVAPDWPTAKSCGTCHAEQYADWSTSRHRVAHTNAIYQAGLMAETQAFCVHCHSPMAEQGREVLANRRWYASHDPRRQVARPDKHPEPLASEGITCAACHWRDGAVLAREVSGRAPHASVATPALTSPQLCGGCHEFTMPSFRADGMHFTDQLMQATLSEWTDWGGRQTCQDCHMPKGAHTWRGAHDRDALVDSVQVKVRRGELRIRSVGVGHHHPTGDLFRNMTVEAFDGAWSTLHRIGRTFEVRPGPDGHADKRITADTSLRPGEWQTVSLPATATAWRVRYHYGSPADEHRGLIPTDQLIHTLHEGTLR